MRNRLLNFKKTKRTLPILSPDLPKLEDALADGEKFTVNPRLRSIDDAGGRNSEIYFERSGTDAMSEMLQEDFEAKRLHADLSEAELQGQLLGVYRSARTDLEETGANTLYLALGFLCWFQTKTSQDMRKAPLILIPVELERSSVQEGFRIRQGDDEPRVNVTLLELLRKDFGIEISSLDPLPEDEHGIDIPRILNLFREAIKHVDRWEVVEEAWIGQFSFTKFLMWRDLEKRTDQLLRNKVVAHLINTPNKPFSREGEFPDAAALDRTHTPMETFCPLSSDSSQLAAVYAAADGRTFVLEGPPGTGKSQTITNLIYIRLQQAKQSYLFQRKWRLFPLFIGA